MSELAEDREVECAKVLVVDQEQRSYEAIKHGLSKHGYEIHTSTNTTKALALAGAHRYKVALLSLPLACDTTLLAGLQHELPDLCIIVTFSSTPCEDSHHIPPQLLRVATNSMGKPFTVERVQLMLDHALELASLRTQVRQQRQAWVSGEILVSPPDDSECGPKPTPMSLEDVLAQKLRPIVPSLEHLGRGSLHRVVLSYVEKLLLTIVLTECRGNQLKSAEILGINRNTLRKKIREFKLSFPRGGS